jgi:hypothetical protein
MLTSKHNCLPGIQMKIRLEKKGDYFVPSLTSDALLANGFKQDEIIEFEAKRPRNAQFHKKYFALLQIIVDNTDYINVDQVLILMKLKLGYYNTIINTNGKVVYEPKSISFASMDEFTFHKFYNDTIDVLLRDFLPNWQNEDTQKVIDQVVRF